MIFMPVLHGFGIGICRKGPKLKQQSEVQERMAPLATQKQIAGLLAWLIISFIAAAIGAAASIQAGPFYTQLVRPNWAPPPAIFGPVWTALYALMGIVAWLVWRVGGFRAAKSALTLFLVQLALNALWSWLFFGWHLGALAFADIVLLWALIVATLISFWRIKPLAGALLVPYLLWVSFASVLNYSVWQLNPQVLG
jgi:tryptophan-rich sensory protein